MATDAAIGGIKIARNHMPPLPSHEAVELLVERSDMALRLRSSRADFVTASEDLHAGASSDATNA